MSLTRSLSSFSSLGGGWNLQSSAWSLRVGVALALALFACGDDTASGGSGAAGGSAAGGAPEGGAPPAGGAPEGGAPATGGGGAATGGAPEGGGSAMGGGGGAPMLNCEPSANGVIDASCGVFVQPGAAPGDGSQAQPYASLSAALAARGPSTFYVCGAGMVEAATLGAGDVVHGRVACSDWSWSNEDLTWTANAGAIPVTIDGDGSATITKLTGIVIDAPPPLALGSIQARSSVGLVARNAVIHLDRVSVFAADALAGDNGSNGTTPAAGTNGNPGVYSSQFGGGGGASACGRTGGNGGNVFNGTFSNGGTGMLNTAGGLAVSLEGGLDTNCKGDDGAFAGDGADGTHGAGLGLLTLAGFAGVDGTSGAQGPHGNGGGGGGGRNLVGTPSSATGGGGGGGGCGGGAGGAGLAGGSSIAVISLNSTWSFSDVSLAAGAGGNGGDRGVGAIGSFGGSGPNAIASMGQPLPCKGGNGSKGGAGGDGGSGAGGHALLIAYKGTAPSLASVITVSPTSAGVGGVGAGNGVAADLLMFP